MFKAKISGMAAGAGFILSLLLGIITGASFPLLLIRALVFAAVFFALVSAGYWAIAMYLPDLVDAVLDNPGEAPTLGARVDISVGDDTVPDAAGFGDIDINPDISLEAGDFEFMENPGETGNSGENRPSLRGNTLDQNDESGYTGLGDSKESPPATGDGVNLLPDLDLISGAFGSGAVSAGKGEESGAVSLGGSQGSSLFDVESRSAVPGKKGIAGEFAGKNVQEMASAIQTILKREDKG